MTVAAAVAVRDLRPKDLRRVIEIDARHTGESKPAYWRNRLNVFLARFGDELRVGLGATDGDRLVGYLLGEVRAFEFGSEPCGWIFAVGVDPAQARSGAGSALLAEACRRFRAHGVRQVRTMVRRGDVPVLAFFRANGFVGGPFQQLEIDLANEVTP